MMYAIHKRTKHHVAITDWNHDFWHYYIVTFCEDWNFKKADPDGWIEWQGDNEKPLPDGSEEFEIRTRRGDEGKGILGRWTWGRNTQQQEYDIIAYRPILDADTNPKAPAWTGDGLPPVGCECEVLGAPGGTYCPAVIDYIDGRHCVWHWLGSAPDDTMHNRVERMRFRPIRSEEDRAVDEMVSLFNVESGYSFHDLCRTLYRAGYRK